jgi:hypothetical protein
MSKPRCKKCNRPLRDPVSVAIGVGPECRGDAGGGKSVNVKVRRPRKGAYCAFGQSVDVAGHVVAHGPDGWTWDGKPIAEAWLLQHFPSVVAGDVSSPTIVRGEQAVMEFSR